MKSGDVGQRFQLESAFAPTGDQPRAIAELTEGLLRGDPYQVLLGATGTGKSVGYDDSVFVVEQHGEERIPRVVAIGELIDRCLAEAGANVRRVGDTEILDLPPATFYTQSFDPATGETGLFPISAFTRHAAPDAMYHLRTGCGRSITLTGDHNLWVLRDGRLQLIETSDAQPSDYIPLPDSLPEEGPMETLDTLALLSGARLFVSAPEAMQEYVSQQGLATAARALRTAGIRHPYTKLPGAHRRPDGIAIDTFHRVLECTKRFGETWGASTAFVGGNAATNRLPVRLPLTPSFLRLLGYYIAEGCSARGYFSLANRNACIRADVETALRHLGVPFSIRPTSDHQVSSTALTEALRRLCGKTARSKHLPDFWPQLSGPQLGQLLRAYFDGDGTVGRASDVSATTASERLASDLAYALLRFGIWARLTRRRKRATNTDHTGDWYYYVTISGQDNLRRFRDHIGFSVSYKQEALERECERAANSNVDVVPIDGTRLQFLRRRLGLSARTLGSLGGVSRSAVQLYEKHKRRPGRSVLRAMLMGLQEEAIRKQLREPDWWEAWDALRRLCEVRWTPVTRIERIAYTHPYVYDFTVPGPETFLAGSGGLFVHNTFAVSHVIQNVNRPVLVMSHNKTLAAQLYAELKQFFPHNAVEFFISYYDYYQPEAYIVHSDTYIEKDMAINERIDRLRLRATSSLVSGRRDVIVVASVSCIYGLGSPEEYRSQIAQVKVGQTLERNDLLRQLINIYYERNDVEFTPGKFRVRGDVVEVFPAYMEEQAYRIEFWGDEIERISVIEALTGKVVQDEPLVTIYPAKIFVTPKDQLEKAIRSIEEELRWRLAVLREEGKLLEAQRLEQRTMFDLEMIKEVGYCSGIENYSRHLTGRAPGERPYCLFDYFPDDYLLVIDESHVTIPQVRAMYNGDRARKLTLVEHGFRLPSALDNRPMTFEEFEARHNQVLFVSATPGDYELEKTGGVFVEQIIRPTGIPDPEVTVRPTEGQIDDLLEECRATIERGERALVTTLTKRMAEDLTDYLDSFGVRVRYLHSDIDALERVEILRDLRLGDFDVLIGVNLLREGLDLPEVSLVAILDADKEGFLRSERSLIQTAGRAARNANSRIVMYADTITGSMERMIAETNRRREIQLAYNREHGITPKTVYKSREEILRGTVIAEEKAEREGHSAAYYAGPQDLPMAADPVVKYLTADQKRDLIAQLRNEMALAAENLEFERAAELRDSIAQIEAELRK